MSSSVFENTAAVRALEGFAELFAHSLWTPILHKPDDPEYGMPCEDIWFPSLDGVILEGWYIPTATPSDLLVICNHFLPGNRSGYPGHLKGFDQFGGFEVNFLPHYKQLHEAGYNIICYDMRNHGRSGTGSGGVVGIGLLEYRDVIGSLRYAKSRPDTSKMNVYLLSICLGADSTFVAYKKYPKEFEDIKAMVALQPVSARPLVERINKEMGIDFGCEVFDSAYFNKTGFHMDELSPGDYAPFVFTPTLVIQVHDDSMSFPEDVQSIYDKIGAKDKKLYWIGGTTRRFDGYNFLAKDASLMLDWFSSHNDKKIVYV